MSRWSSALGKSRGRELSLIGWWYHLASKIGGQLHHTSQGHTYTIALCNDGCSMVGMVPQSYECCRNDEKKDARAWQMKHFVLSIFHNRRRIQKKKETPFNTRHINRVLWLS